MSNHIEEKALQPNIGFLLREAAGYRRQLELEFDSILEVDELKLDQLRGMLELTRTSEGVWVDGKVRVQIPSICARCLGGFEYSLQAQLQELFYFPASRAPGQADYVIQEDGVLDLTGPLREQLLLVVPIKSFCRPDCKGLCGRCGYDLNQGNCNCQDDEIDPRLAQLRELKELLSKDQEQG